MVVFSALLCLKYFITYNVMKYSNNYLCLKQLSFQHVKQHLGWCSISYNPQVDYNFFNRLEFDHAQP